MKEAFYMDDNLIHILKEHYEKNPNILEMETIDFCISTNYFGFGSLKALAIAHKNNYRHD